LAAGTPQVASALSAGDTVAPSADDVRDLGVDLTLRASVRRHASMSDVVSRLDSVTLIQREPLYAPQRLALTRKGETAPRLSIDLYRTEW
jgi:hypothetical protein